MIYCHIITFRFRNIGATCVVVRMKNTLVNIVDVDSWADLRGDVFDNHYGTETRKLMAIQSKVLIRDDIDLHDKMYWKSPYRLYRLGRLHERNCILCNRIVKGRM